MPTHRVHHEAALSPGLSLEIHGDEAKHAVRTKRLAEGDTLEILTGTGQIGDARITRISRQARPGGGKDWVMSIQVELVRDEPRTRPQIHLRSGVPKGPRLEALIEAVSQAGAASWAPLETRRSVVDPRPTKLARMQRVAAEASKQCGRAWMLEIQPSQSLATILKRADARPDRGQLVIADAAAPPYEPTAAETLTLLIGPEGGFEPDELDAAIDAGASPASFGPHTMRIETACAVACAIVFDTERRAR